MGEKAEAHLSSLVLTWPSPGGIVRENLTEWVLWTV